ncbi:MAG: DEAD/DEAH box helicase [Nanoarchaeota archaeon]
MEFLEGIEPREYQIKIFETCIKKNCLVVLSTGLGKTLIGLMVAIERMKQFPGEKVVFLAPTRPLAEQHLMYFKKHLPELFADMQIFTGQVNPESRKKIWETADIIFSTPQCISHDVKNNLYDLKNVCLLVEDEAHRCMKNYDYNFIAKNYVETAMNPRIIGLTASPGSEKSKIKEICRNLSIEEVELRGRESSDVKNYIQELEFEKIIIDFPPELEEIRQALLKLLMKYINELKNRRLLFGPPTKTALIELQKKIMHSISIGNKNFNYLAASSVCAQAIKIQHALELLETQTLQSFNNYLKELLHQSSEKKSKGVVKLVARPEFTFAYLRSNILLEKRIEHPKVQELISIIKKEFKNNESAKIIVFTQFRDTASIISKRLNEIKNVRSKIFVGQAKRTNAGQITGLNQKEQREIINQFSSGELNVLCATSIGEEGLDIPEVNVVVFYEPIPSAIRAIQRAGRTARLIKGKLIVLITRKTRDEAYFYVSKAREKKMHESIGSIKEDMQNKLRDTQKELK